MDRLDTIAALRRWREARRARRVALVPTMGALHAGHLSLVEAARRDADAVVMSIFVNPLQFGAGEDLERYPRPLERDLALAGDAGVAACFVPDAAEMYPPGTTVRVVPGPAAGRWEGAERPGHFAGVLTVVTKLFHLVEPAEAWFGQKDIQQLVLIRAMVRDLDHPVTVRMGATVRDVDGLALSSRNRYLAPAERERALAIPRSLEAATARWRAGEARAAELETVVRDTLAREGGLRADYIAVAEPDHLAPVETAGPGTVIALAARVGATRLLDNTILKEPDA